MVSYLQGDDTMFKDFIHAIMNPVKIIVINKSAKLHQEDFHFISMVKDKEQTRLWVVHFTTDDLTFGKVLKSENPVFAPHKFTNREHHLYSIKFQQNRPIHILNFKIEDQTYNVSKKFAFKSHKFSFDEKNPIKDFHDKTLIPARFYEYNSSHVTIREYFLGRDVTLPKIIDPASISISIKMAAHNYTYPIEQPITLSFHRDFEEQVDLTAMNNQTCRCYFHPLTLNDIHAEEEKSFDPLSPNLSHLTADQIVEFRQLRRDSFLRLCPEDKVLAMVNYEIEDGYSMEVFLSESLDLKPEKIDHTAGVTVSFYKFADDHKYGRHGLRNHAMHLKAVSHDFDLPIDAEIMKLHRHIPGGTYDF